MMIQFGMIFLMLGLILTSFGAVNIQRKAEQVEKQAEKMVPREVLLKVHQSLSDDSNFGFVANWDPKRDIKGTSYFVPAYALLPAMAEMYRAYGRPEDAEALQEMIDRELAEQEPSE